MTQSNLRMQSQPASGSTSLELAAPLEAYAQRLRAELRLVEGQLAAVVVGPAASTLPPS